VKSAKFNYRDDDYIDSFTKGLSYTLSFTNLKESWIMEDLDFSSAELIQDLSNERLQRNYIKSLSSFIEILCYDFSQVVSGFSKYIDAHEGLAVSGFNISVTDSGKVKKTILKIPVSTSFKLSLNLMTKIVSKNLKIELPEEFWKGFKVAFYYRNLILHPKSKIYCKLDEKACLELLSFPAKILNAVLDYMYISVLIMNYQHKKLKNEEVDDELRLIREFKNSSYVKVGMLKE
jgi:hypothetical protein